MIIIIIIMITKIVIIIIIIIIKMIIIIIIMIIIIIIIMKIMIIIIIISCVNRNLKLANSRKSLRIVKCVSVCCGTPNIKSKTRYRRTTLGSLTMLVRFYFLIC